MAKKNKGILNDVMANVLLNMEGFFSQEGNERMFAPNMLQLII